MGLLDRADAIHASKTLLARLLFRILATAESAVGPVTAAYRILKGFLEPAKLAALVEPLLLFNAARPLREQSGRGLSDFDGELYPILMPLAEFATMEFGSPASIYLDRSSVRVQPPSQPMTLGPHQDAAPLDAHRANAKGLTFWVPLCPVDRQTPTLAFYKDRVGRILSHRSDTAGYSVLTFPTYRMQPLPDLELGDVVVIWPDSIHASFVPHRATKTRISLDIRALGERNWMDKAARFVSRVKYKVGIM